jgi:hypothetical protein
MSKSLSVSSNKNQDSSSIKTACVSILKEDLGDGRGSYPWQNIGFHNSKLRKDFFRGDPGA